MRVTMEMSSSIGTLMGTKAELMRVVFGSNQGRSLCPTTHFFRIGPILNTQKLAMIDDSPSNLFNQQPMHERLNQICELIGSLKLTPKKFIQNLKCLCRLIKVLFELGPDCFPFEKPMTRSLDLYLASVE
ncbi:hypothetical protein CROQUDRAFT_628036 [Cronartium quercuum f. sp. fusiforme G11]|uniref:Uncharacterized protein n=1 Tax=Cronartium quercuum f. sp. fusiforme G11 TaxID=708437 RepID=A0A9P6NV52_9BASI|nr:hypothetical protein CROQUDRAFT_628036 [Cronartium quercuum f. sp. fusiforme G11]